jgi:methionyl-tRNA synthetase
VPPRGELTNEDSGHLEMLAELPDKVGELIEGYRFKDALNEVMAAAREGNRYFDYRQPWVLRKEDKAACGTVLNVCLNTIRTLTVVMEPFLPFAADKAARMLGLTAGERTWQAAAEPLPQGRKLGEAEVLFAKLDELPAEQ